MKKFITASLFLAFTLLLTNCKKDKDEDKASWTSTVDGTTFAGNYGIGTLETDRNKFFVVLYESSTKVDKYIEVSIAPNGNDEIEVGKTYIMDNSDASYQEDSNIQYSTSNSANTITLSKYDKSTNKVSGTFTFKARSIGSSNEILVTGSFTNIPFTVF